MRFSSQLGECRNLRTGSHCVSVRPPKGSAPQGFSWWDSARDFHVTGVNSLFFSGLSCLLEKRQHTVTYLCHLAADILKSIPKELCSEYEDALQAITEKSMIHWSPLLSLLSCYRLCLSFQSNHKTQPHQSRECLMLLHQRELHSPQ